MSWSCTQTAENLTVGSVFIIECQGEATRLDMSRLRIIDKDSKELALRILKVESASDTQLIAQVTSYIPGEHGEVDGFVLTDGSVKVPLTGLTFKLESVLPIEGQQEPYPAYGAIEIGFPWWFWLSLVLFFLSLIASGYYIFKTSADRRRKVKELTEFKNNHSPLITFYKELRLLERQMDVSDSLSNEWSRHLQKELLMFLSRELIEPLDDIRARNVIRFLKKKFTKNNSELGDRASALFVELSRANKQAVVPKATAAQLLKMTTQFADRWDTLHSKRRMK